MMGAKWRMVNAVRLMAAVYCLSKTAPVSS